METTKVSYRTHMARCLLGVAFAAGIPAATQVAEWPSALNLSTLDGTTGIRLAGAAAGDYSGLSVSGAGDVNGDGFADLIVGAYIADPDGKSNAGSSYVVFGRAPNTTVLRGGSRAVQAIQGGGFADLLVGVSAGDRLEGRGGGDILVGDLSTTASYAHAPSAVAASLAAPTFNSGDAAGDSYFAIQNLEGTGLGDILTGNTAVNILIGGKGKDSLRGGKGKDVFAYRFANESPTGAANSDVILDFEPGTATGFVDKIDLSGIDAKTSVGGNQAFAFKGTGAITGVGQVKLKKVGANLVIQGNTGGSTAPEFEIVLKGLGSKASLVTAKDFKL